MRMVLGCLVDTGRVYAVLASIVIVDVCDFCTQAGMGGFSG